MNNIRKVITAKDILVEMNRRGCKQSEMARDLGIDRAKISRYLSGLTEIGNIDFQRIVIYLNL